MRRKTQQNQSLFASWQQLLFGKRQRRSRRLANPRQRRFMFERLEGRSLLAATDLAAIQGVVFDDFTGNGFDPGEEVAGATINLYTDDGDGIFEPGGDDALADTAVTDAAGEYRFEDLTVGDYWVHQPDQVVGPTTLVGNVSPLITIDATDVMGIPIDTIDSFDTTTQSVTASSMGSTTDSSSAAATEAIGGERDLFVELTSASGELVLDVNGLTLGLLEFQASSTAQGDRIITYDGADGDATVLDPTGLGGIDLTAGGNASAISLTIGADQANGQLTVRVYTDGGNFSTATVAIPNTGGTANDSLVIKYTDFTVAAGTGADFTNVGAIEIEIEGIAAVDGQLDLVETLGPTVFTQDFDNFETVDVSLTKTVDDATPNVGQNVTFTITVANAGPEDATNVAVTDILPAGLTFVSATPSQGSYDDGTGLWTVGTLANGADATLTITATVTTAGAKINTAEVMTVDQFDMDSTPNNNEPGEDDQASVTVTPSAIDLSLTKTVDDNTPNVGQNVTFTITVANAGPDGATGVEVTDALPAGLTFVSATPSQGTYDNVTGIWTVGAVAASDSETLTLVATVASTGAKINTAEVTDATEADSDSTPDNGVPTEDDQASVTVTPTVIDLSLTKTVDNAAANVGQNVTFTVTVLNAGPDGATGVAVLDTLPAGLTFVSATPSQGTYDNGTGVWTVGSVASSANASLQIVATVASAGAKVNTAQVSAADQADVDSTPNNNNASEDDQASVTVTPPAIDLSLTKTVNDATPDVGQNVTFTVTVANGGPDDATNVEVTDLLPAGLTFVSSTPSQGTYNSATGIWTVGSIADGANASLQIVATVASVGAKINTAQVSDADQTDTDSTPGNNNASEDDQASVTVTPTVIDLSLTKTVNSATVDLNQNATFTVTVSNAGPDAATGVAVLDQLPAGLTFVSSTPSQGTYSSATGIWTVGSIASGGSATLQIVATVATAGTKTNTAQVSAADQADSDSTPNNSVATEDDQASVNVSPAQIDLSLTKTVNNATPDIASNVTFTITVSNAGPAAATGVAVTDALPAGLTFVSATPSVGTYSNATGIWTVGNLASGANATLALVATVSTAGAKVNTAQVTAASPSDIDSTPNNNVASEDDQASVTVTPQLADLSLTKTVNTSTPLIGSNVTFTLTVSNAGPAGATSVSVEDVLPSGLTFVSATASQGTFAAATGLWTVGSLASGANATLQIVATVTSTGTIVNTAQVETVTQGDPDSTPGNGVTTEDDLASVTLTPRRGLSKRMFLAR